MAIRSFASVVALTIVALAVCSEVDIGDQISVVNHKKSDEKRVYNHTGPVAEFYTWQHRHLTHQISQDRKATYTPTRPVTVRDLLLLCEDLMDPSDPDISLSQIHHAFQTAEMCRAMVDSNPTLPDWLPLIGLVHDLGKATAKTHDIVWAELSGDMYPTGCAFDENIVLRDLGFDENPDTHDERYNTKNGIYQPGCGFDNMSFWGHDEIIYQMLKHSRTELPEEALYVVHYHSFYAWHSQNGYAHLASEVDRARLGILRAHQNADLYSKTDEEPWSIAKLEDPYYQNLIAKYFPHGLLI
eukprot:m.332149 g.332149  ORF g.332149 m.332149 type:complete len:299 (-) comp16886_c0_seq1:224-1120(-)